jgi:hypothetical protein
MRERSLFDFVICDLLFFIFAVLFGRCEVCHGDEEHTSACMHDDCGH